MIELTKEIINFVKARDKKIMIGISGHGAAGKTTFANQLIQDLNQEEVAYLNTDPYIINSDIRKHTMIDYSDQNEKHHYKMTACHPAAHHLPSLERDVQMLRTGLDLYTIDTHYQKSELLSAKKKVTIVEGMSVAFLDPRLFDLKIYFYTDGETELKRRTDRDIIERGADGEYLRQSHAERRIQYELFMHPYSENFDVIIQTSQQGIKIEKGLAFNN
ncbi:uridine kinase family protein [Robertmurraya massiliosenegalensis]|uniref:uridine kinase family protein n=1 Tax=Robertmurraya massiliosenegalensis TaxID=1287657 RepID=UPI00031A2B5E|nr:hypothetical protein [Robertmurraya massiliosenegalensis]